MRKPPRLNKHLSEQLGAGRLLIVLEREEGEGGGEGGHVRQECAAVCADDKTRASTAHRPPDERSACSTYGGPARTPTILPWPPHRRPPVPTPPSVVARAPSGPPCNDRGEGGPHVAAVEGEGVTAPGVPAHPPCLWRPPNPRLGLRGR